MAIPTRFLYRNFLQLLLCFACFNLGYFSAYVSLSSPDNALESSKSSAIKSEKAFLVVLVISSPTNFERRKAIRETWLNLPKRLRSEVVHFFAIGSTNLNEKDEESLNSERFAFKDLLELGDVEESFSELTTKVLRSLVEVNSKVDLKYLLKVDDDSFARVPALVEELRQSNYDRALYWGFFDGRAPVIRNERNKYVERNYVLCDRYVPYALGGGYVLSADLVEFVARNADALRKYRNEDASLGTWLAPLQVNRVHDTRFDTEFKSRGCSNKYLVTHKQSVQEMRSKQYSLTARDVLCEREEKLRKSYEYDWTVPPSQCCVRSSAFP